MHTQDYLCTTENPHWCVHKTSVLTKWVWHWLCIICYILLNIYDYIIICYCVGDLKFTPQHILDLDKCILNHHPSATTLRSQTSELNNPNYLVTMAPVKVWDISGRKWSLCWKLDKRELMESDPRRPDKAYANDARHQRRGHLQRSVEFMSRWANTMLSSNVVADWRIVSNLIWKFSNKVYTM